MVLIEWVWFYYRSQLDEENQIYWVFTLCQNLLSMLLCYCICVPYHPCKVRVPIFQTVWPGSEMVGCCPTLHSWSVEEPHAPSPPSRITVETLQRLNASTALSSLTMCQDWTFAISHLRLTWDCTCGYHLCFTGKEQDSEKYVVNCLRLYTKLPSLFRLLTSLLVPLPLRSERRCGKCLDIKLFKRLRLHRNMLKHKLTGIILF